MVFPMRNITISGENRSFGWYVSLEIYRIVIVEGSVIVLTMPQKDCIPVTRNSRARHGAPKARTKPR